MARHTNFQPRVRMQMKQSISENPCRRELRRCDRFREPRINRVHAIKLDASFSNLDGGQADPLTMEVWELPVARSVNCAVLCRRFGGFGCSFGQWAWLRLGFLQVRFRVFLPIRIDVANKEFGTYPLKGIGI